MNFAQKDAELFIGLVARIGVDTRLVVQLIQTELNLYGYIVCEIHVTRVLKDLNLLDLCDHPTEKRYNSYITACNDFRDKTQRNVMALLAIAQIVTERGLEETARAPQQRRAYIINQIKRPEESELLRAVYGEQYVQLSLHADQELRIERLVKLIAKDHPDDPKSPEWNIAARRLASRDEAEEGEPSGQRVAKVFPLSDVVIDTNSEETAKFEIERFLRSLFGDPRVTPTREEYGMELANVASQRSADLSRQVGAAILTPQMEIQALGCNEVPRARGGTYWEGDKPDGREFTLGIDMNDERKKAVLLDLVLRLRKAGLVTEQDDQKLQERLFLRSDNLISDAQLMDSLEYGRAVHAEMNAISDAARVGHRTQGCLLFSNTFPCHNCAKHIVAAGISEVIYVHPYPKSYARELFSDSIAVDPLCKPENKVVFRQFKGILGPMYARVFTKARWKRDSGIVPPFTKASASYVRRTQMSTYVETELLHVSRLQGIFRDFRSFE